MKKLTLTSVLALSLVCPAFADIATNNNNPKCDNTTIGKYEGSTELEAQWNANTINLKWYSENTEITDVENDSKTCTYAGAIDIPTEPERDGYTFAGWVVRPNTFDLSTWAYGTVPSWNKQYIQYRSLIGDDGDSLGSQTGLNDGEWRITFGNGTVKGVATCTTTPGNEHTWDNDWANLSGNVLPGNTFTAGDYNDTDKKYCWCKATGVDTTGNGTYMSVSSPSWVFYNDRGTVGNCANNCAHGCAGGVRNSSGFRSGVFGISQ